MTTRYSTVGKLRKALAEYPEDDPLFIDSGEITVCNIQHALREWNGGIVQYVADPSDEDLIVGAKRTSKGRAVILITETIQENLHANLDLPIEYDQITECNRVKDDQYKTNLRAIRAFIEDEHKANLEVFK